MRVSTKYWKTRNRVNLTVIDYKRPLHPAIAESHASRVFALSSHERASRFSGICCYKDKTVQESISKTRYTHCETALTKNACPDVVLDAFVRCFLLG